jgi:hypothetical protein
MIGILVPIVALLLPVFLVYVTKHFRYKEKLLEVQSRGGSPPLLPAADLAAREKRLAELEERVQNLESIIVAMDTDRAQLGPDTRQEVGKLREQQAAPALPPKQDP